jgi:hypothetical protein
MSPTLSTTVPARQRVLPDAGLRARVLRAALRRDTGAATAEYAVATVAACGFGGVLYKLLSSDFVQTLLMELIKRAFAFLL